VASVSRSEYFRGRVAVLFIRAALFIGWLVVSQLVEAVTGDASSEGNFLPINEAQFPAACSFRFRSHHWDYDLDEIVTVWWRRREHRNSMHHFANTTGSDY
jgi:hypothetical protein